MKKTLKFLIFSICTICSSIAITGMDYDQDSFFIDEESGEYLRQAYEEDDESSSGTGLYIEIYKELIDSGISSYKANKIAEISENIIQRLNKDKTYAIAYAKGIVLDDLSDENANIVAKIQEDLILKGKSKLDAYNMAISFVKDKYAGKMEVEGMLDGSNGDIKGSDACSRLQFNKKIVNCVVNERELTGSSLDLYRKVYNKCISSHKKSATYARMYADTYVGGLPKFLASRVADLGEKTTKSGQGYIYSLEYAIWKLVGHLPDEEAKEMAKEIVHNIALGMNYKKAKLTAINKF